MLMTLKGLPLAYNKDMQEDKEGFFDALEEWQQCLSILAYVIPELSVDVQKAQEAARLGYSNATDLADYLVDRGMAFRDAHEISGRLVVVAIEQRVALESLPLEVMQKESKLIEADVYASLSLEASLARRKAFGGTAPTQVSEALRQAKMRFHGKRAGFTSVRQARLSDVPAITERSEEHTSELQSRPHLVCRLLLEKKQSTEPEQVELVNEPHLHHVRLPPQTSPKALRHLAPAQKKKLVSHATTPTARVDSPLDHPR